MVKSTYPGMTTQKNMFLLIVSFALIKLLIHLGTNAFASYGIFRDEFYYLACSYRLDLGYVDQPPLAIYILAVSRWIFGKSLFALRLLPAIAGAITIFIAGLLVRRMGGNGFAVVISSLAIILAPIILAMNTVYSMNCFDILLWTLAAYLLVKINQENRSRLWIMLGLIIGLGLLNKVSMVWLVFGFILAIILTNQRKQLKTSWPYLSALIVLSLFLPYIIWNSMHDFAHLEFIRNAIRWKYSGIKPIDFVVGQFFLSNPISVPLWVGGIYFYFFNKNGKRFSMLGIIFVVVFLILLVNGHSKPEYMSVGYPILFTGGSIQIAEIMKKKGLKWLRIVFPIGLVIGGMISAPLILPFLSVETFIKYSRISGLSPESPEGKEQGELHQFYADMFGWENMAKTVSAVYTSLPEEQRSRTIVYAQNYGEAGCIEYYSQKYALPAVVSAHNNYWIWGWDYINKDFDTVIVIGGSEESHLRSFEKVTQRAIIRCQYCMPYENNLRVFICKGLKRSLKEIWDSNKHFE